MSFVGVRPSTGSTERLLALRAQTRSPFYSAPVQLQQRRSRAQTREADLRAALLIL